jgi:uncharacterized membrane protein YedE/YeeE
VTAIVAAVLAFVVGFALQRGGICAVLAAREVVEHGRWTRFRAFLECSAWAAIALAAADAVMAKSIQQWTWPSSYAVAAAGGLLFGAGALVNGACAFGSASRLASGEAPFLGVIAGFTFGATLTGQALDVNRMAITPLSPAITAVMLVVALGLMGSALWRGAIALARMKTAPPFGAMLRSAWPPSLIHVCDRFGQYRAFRLGRELALHDALGGCRPGFGRRNRAACLAIAGLLVGGRRGRDER